MEIKQVFPRPKPWKKWVRPFSYKGVPEKLSNFHQPEGATKIEDFDMRELEKALQMYAEDVHCDLYTVAKSFGVSYSTVLKLLKTRMADKFREAQQRRAALFTSTMINVAGKPYEKLQEGKDVSLVELKSADLYAKYLAFVSQRTDPEMQQGVNAAPQLTVNTVIKLKNFGSSPPQALPQAVPIDVTPEEIEDGGSGN